jgi:hypothetical protein
MFPCMDAKLSTSNTVELHSVRSVLSRYQSCRLVVFVLTVCSVCGTLKMICCCCSAQCRWWCLSLIKDCAERFTREFNAMFSSRVTSINGTHFETRTSFRYFKWLTVLSCTTIFITMAVLPYQQWCTFRSTYFDSLIQDRQMRSAIPYSSGNFFCSARYLTNSTIWQDCTIGLTADSQRCRGYPIDSGGPSCYDATGENGRVIIYYMSCTPLFATIPQASSYVVTLFWAICVAYTAFLTIVDRGKRVNHRVTTTALSFVGTNEGLSVMNPMTETIGMNPVNRTQEDADDAGIV